MSLLWASSIRHLLRHPAQLFLALVGLSVGVGTIIAVDIATASAGRAFQLSMQAVNGAATHSIVGGAQGIDERLYVGMRKRLPTIAPVVEGYVVVGERTMQLIGVDPFASASLDRSGHGVGRALGWFTQPGAVVMSDTTARHLGLRVNQAFGLEVGGRSFAAVLISTVPADQAY